MVPETTVKAILGTDAYPSLHVNLDEIENGLQRKLISEI